MRTVQSSSFFLPTVSMTLFTEDWFVYRWAQKGAKKCPGKKGKVKDDSNDLSLMS